MQPEILEINEMTLYTPETKTFSIELSDNGLKRISIVAGIKLVNPKTGNSRIFKHFKTDYMDPTHEDIGGWWFKNEEGFKLLVIND